MSQVSVCLFVRVCVGGGADRGRVLIFEIDGRGIGGGGEQ